MKVLSIITLAIAGILVASCGSSRSYDHDVVYRTPAYDDERYYYDYDDDDVDYDYDYDDDDDDDDVVYYRYRPAPSGSGPYYYYRD